MPTKRTPPKRPHRPRISPEAVRAFLAGDYAELHRILGLKPSEISPLDANPDDPRPYCEGTMGWRTWPKAITLREELEEVAAHVK